MLIYSLNRFKLCNGTTKIKKNSFIIAEKELKKKKMQRDKNNFPQILALIPQLTGMEPRNAIPCIKLK